MPDDFDFSALDPSGDAAFEARVRRVANDAMDARLGGQRAEPSGVVSALMSWTRPTMFAAGILLAIALTTLVRTSSVGEPAAPTDALGLPRPLADILHSTTPPSLVELDVALAAVTTR